MRQHRFTSGLSSACPVCLSFGSVFFGHAKKSNSPSGRNPNQASNTTAIPSECEPLDLVFRPLPDGKALIRLMYSAREIDETFVENKAAPEDVIHASIRVTAIRKPS